MAPATAKAYRGAGAQPATRDALAAELRTVELAAGGKGAFILVSTVEGQQQWISDAAWDALAGACQHLGFDTVTDALAHMALPDALSEAIEGAEG